MLSVILKKNRLAYFLFFLFVNNNAVCHELGNIDEQLKSADAIRSSNPKEFNNILEQLEGKRKHLTNEQTYLLNYLYAYKQSISGDLENAVRSYKVIVNSNASNKLKFRANLSIVNIFGITQNWAEGLHYLSKNYKIIKDLPNDETKQAGLIVSSIFYNLLGQYELGYKYSSMVLASTKNSRTFCTANQLVIEANFKLKRIKADSKEISQAINACKDANEIIMTSQIYVYLALLHIDNGNNQKAKNILLGTIKAIEKSNYLPVIAGYYALLAEIYLEEHNYTKSSEYANKAISKAGSSGNSKSLISAYLSLYKVYLQQQSHQKALTYYIKYSETNNAHLEGEKAKHLAFQLAEHNAFEQESQIKLLNEQNVALAAEQALAKTRATNKKLIILSLTLIIVVLSFLGLRLWSTHKRVRQLAEYDPLTGIYNRGHFTQVTQSALKYCQNAEQDLSLIMFDLDHFKKVNDDFGHACGDWALKETIKVCKDIGRKNDVFARLGGEEFCLVLPSCNIDVAMLRAEACRIAIESIITEESGHDFTITASFGVTDVKRSGFDLDSLLADADMAAYDSKKSGRNKVTVHQVPEKKTEQLDNSWSM